MNSFSEFKTNRHHELALNTEFCMFYTYRLRGHIQATYEYLMHADSCEAHDKPNSIDSIGEIT